MTRLAILADIHGNLPALHAVMADMQPFNPDHVIVAGDMINWGPQSAEVMETLTQAGWAMVRGNNEYYLLDYNTPRQPAHWRGYVLLPWLAEQLEGHWHRVIAALPDELSLRFPDAPPIRVVHGVPNNPWVSMVPNQSDEALSALLAGVWEGTIIGAHSHIAMDRCVGQWHVLNPGSVGVPLDGNRTAGYMLLDGHESGWQATFRRVPFDLNALLDAFSQQRFVERCGKVAELVIEEFVNARLYVHPFNEWKREQFPQSNATPELYATFETVDRWQYTPSQYHLNRS